MPVMDLTTSSYSEVYDCKSDDDLDLSDVSGEVKGDMLSFFLAT